jgi:hypothetical protein
MGELGPDFPHGLSGSPFSGCAVGLAQDSQVCEQWGFLTWSPPPASGSTVQWFCCPLSLEEPSQRAVGAPPPISCTGFRELSSVVLLWGKLSLLACAFCESVGAKCPAYTGTLVSLAFQGEGSRSCGGGSMELWVPYVYWEVGLTTREVPSDGTWSQVTSGVGDQECWVVNLLIPPVVSCFSDCGFREGFASCWLWDPVGDF